MATQVMDAVLPLRDCDFERFERLLLPSMRRFFEALGTCWIITPEVDYDGVLARVEDDRFVVIPETELLPNLHDLWDDLCRVSAAVPGREAPVDSSVVGRPPGWFLQQVIKLAASKQVLTEFYLTLDADIIFVRPTSYADLVRNERGIALVYHSDEDLHADWYRWAEAVLGFSRSGRTHGVTPAILSTSGTRELLRFLVDKQGGTCDEDEALISALPWTEYTLYYTYLEHHNLFERYHFGVSAPFYEHSIWLPEDRIEWDPAKAFQETGSSFFSVLQSHSTSVDDLASLVRPYLDR